jgi:hypothetical protein
MEINVVFRAMCVVAFTNYGVQWRSFVRTVNIFP